jgi:hypothetical protein
MTREILPEEVAEWKYHPVTVEFFAILKDRVEGLRDEIVANILDSDPRLLAWKAGAIQAILDILDTDF